MSPMKGSAQLAEAEATGKTQQESKGIRRFRNERPRGCLSLGLDRDARTGVSLNRLPGSSVFELQKRRPIKILMDGVRRCAA